MNRSSTVLAVIISLAAVAIACIVGVIVLALDGRAVPGILETMAPAAVGALAGLLANTHTEPAPPAPAPVAPAAPAVPHDLPPAA